MTIVMVCVPAKGRVVHIGEPTGVLTPSEMQPVGFLAGFAKAAIEDHDQVSRDLGLPVKFLVTAVKCEDADHQGCLYAMAVECASYAAAAKLPGFIPFGECAAPIAFPKEQVGDAAI